MNWQDYLRQMAVPMPQGEQYPSVDYGPGGFEGWGQRNPQPNAEWEAATYQTIRRPANEDPAGYRYAPGMRHRDPAREQYPELRSVPGRNAHEVPADPAWIDYLLNGPLRAGELR